MENFKVTNKKLIKWGMEVIKISLMIRRINNINRMLCTWSTRSIITGTSSLSASLSISFIACACKNNQLIKLKILLKSFLSLTARTRSADGTTYCVSTLYSAKVRKREKYSTLIIQLDGKPYSFLYFIRRTSRKCKRWANKKVNENNKSHLINKFGAIVSHTPVGSSSFSLKKNHTKHKKIKWRETILNMKNLCLHLAIYFCLCFTLFFVKIRFLGIVQYEKISLVVIFWKCLFKILNFLCST